MKRCITTLSLGLLLSLSACNLSGGQPTPPPATVASGPTAPASRSSVGGATQARVVPVQHAALSLPMSGVVAEVLVSEGQAVQAGQPLLRLEQARTEASIAQAEAAVQAARAGYEKLRAGATPEQIAIAEAQLNQAQAQVRQVQGGVTASDIAAAHAQLEQARAALARLTGGPDNADLRQVQAEVDQAQAALQTQRDSLSAAKTRAESQLEQAANAVRDRQADYSRVFWENRRLEEQLRGAGQTLPQENQDREAAAQRAVQSAEEGMRQAQLAVEQAQQAEIGGIAAAEAQLQSAQARRDKLLTGAGTDQLAAARAQVAQAEANLNKLLGDQRAGSLGAAQAAAQGAAASLEQLRAGAAPGDLTLAAAQVQQAEAALKLAQVARSESELRAPFAGTVAVVLPTVGEYVAMGTPVVQLANLAAWQIETTDMNEQRVVDLKEGGLANVTFDAIPDLELQGTVSRINPLGENKQGDITYAVVIKLAQQDPRLRWNMTAAVSFER
ncbi:MAG: HlyD family efflux transporter periplasmic adaptor subunit [Chloroflexaceae bacterium]|nr:HlyD family efflux transporter periplasmic adaptor subunit [Chloroflexaceae bacterium]